MFLAAPLAFKGRLVQYAGRILRAYPGKATAEIHDYHDTDTPVLAASLAKRAPGYTSLGFPDPRRLPLTPSAVPPPASSAGGHDEGPESSALLTADAAVERRLHALGRTSAAGQDLRTLHS